LAESEANWDLAVRERRAVLALRPVNRADAQYRLAGALYRSGDLDAARRAVLEALELAPSFEAAQELLLEIHDARALR
jgi:tetratricopeptide (TPR) repeat protein